ncbi:MAG: LLM class flavin-dependent oxidoreductase, partial [Pseudomonadota bacterium]
LLLGVASGDRPEEYPALGANYPDRGARFRESLAYIRAAAGAYPTYAGAHGRLNGGMDMLPKPTAARLPVLITGGAQQSPDWVAEHGDGWMTYPRDPRAQGRLVADYRARSEAAGAPQKPVMQSLYIDLLPDPAAPPRPIHLGFQSGTDFLRGYLAALAEGGVNHVALNLRFNGAGLEDTMERLAQDLLPEFPTPGDIQ